MADKIPAGDGAPPATATDSPAVTSAPANIPGELGANVTIAEYARRKADEAKATEAKPAKRQKAAVQKQPDKPRTGPEKSEALSQAAAIEPEETPALEPDESASPPSPESEPADEPSETTEEPEESAEQPESEPESETDQDLPGDAPEWVRKRMARYTRQKAELERKFQEADGERQQLRTQVEQLKTSGAGDPPVPVVIDKNDPASSVTNEQQLETLMGQARWLKRWCERNPEGGTLEVPDGKGGVITREFSAEGVRAMKESTEDDIEEHLPRRREFLRAQGALSQEALRDHPWLNDKASPRLEKFRQVVAGYPALRLRPDWIRAAAIYVRGLEAVEAEQKAAAGVPPTTMPKPKVPPPPKMVSAARTAPPRATPGSTLKAQIASAEKAWNEAPVAKNFARLQELRRQQRGESAA